MVSSKILGTQDVKKLIFNLGWPAALNFLVVAVYNLTDVIFVGRFLGTVQIAAVVIVGTITFLFSSFGLAIGIGGASIIARALGEKDKEKVAYVFGNQNILVFFLSLVIVLFGWFFEDFILRLFGANGNILPYAIAYYRILLFGVPFLSWSMMGNNVIHTEGNAKIAMFNSLLPTIVNIFLNPLFIIVFHMGIEGSAWATMTAYILSFLLVLYYFVRGSSEVRFSLRYLKVKFQIIGEIAAIGGSVLVNIFTSNLFTIVLNQILFKYQHESGMVIMGIINRVNLLFLIPIIGMEGGIRPIIGYNFGNKQVDRIRDTIKIALKYGVFISYFLLILVLLSANYLIHLFTNDDYIATETPFAMKIVFSFFPMIMIQVITNTYFQAIAKPKIAFYLILLKNVVLLIPLLYIFSHYFGYYGILFTFPIVDVLTTLPALWLLKNDLRLNTAKIKAA